MSKRINAKKKVSRALGVNLWGRANDTFTKKNYRPGEHGTALKRETSYGTHLKAKQKLKKYYGNITEKQFKRIFAEAKRLRGSTDERFAGLLERRLDILVYRANFVPTVFAARQLVNHKHILVNGKTVNIPSYLVKPGDVIEVREKSKKLNIIEEALQNMERDIPSYLELNAQNKELKFLNVPSISDIPYPVEMDINLVVEFYYR